MALSKIKAPSIADDSITVDQIADTAVHGRRNLIINGAMNVAQRGTSFAAVSNAYTVDRFKVNKTSGVDELVMTATQDSSAPNGFSKSLKVDVTTAETAIASDERVEIEHRIEAQDCRHFGMGTADAKNLTLSFWVKSSITGTFGINFRLHDADKSQGASYTINTADTWEYKTIKMTKTTSHSITNDNGIGMWVRWGLIVGSNFQDDSVVEDWVAPATGWYPTGLQSTWGTNTSHNFWLTGVQLEVGDKATPFEHRSYGEELALCNRYYYESQDDEFMDTVGSVYNSLSNTRYAHHVRGVVPRTMRAAPTVSILECRVSSTDVTSSYQTISSHADRVQFRNGYSNHSNQGDFFMRYKLDAEL